MLGILFVRNECLTAIRLADGGRSVVIFLRLQMVVSIGVAPADGERGQYVGLGKHCSIDGGEGAVERSTVHLVEHTRPTRFHAKHIVAFGIFPRLEIEDAIHDVLIRRDGAHVEEFLFRLCKVDVCSHPHAVVEFESEVGASAKSLIIGVVKNAGLGEIVGRRIACEPIAAARNGQLLQIGHGVARCFSHPVGTAAAKLCLLGRPPAAGHRGILLIQAPFQRNCFAGIEQIPWVIHQLGGRTVGIFHMHLAGFSLLGGNQDNAVGTSRAINGGGGGVFEDFNRLNIVDVELRHVVGLKTVNHIEWLVLGAHRRGSAHPHRHAAAGFQGVLPHLYARGAPFKKLRHVAYHARLNVVGFQRGDGAGQIALLRHAIAHHNHIFQRQLVGAHRNVEPAARRYFHHHLLRGHAEERKLQRLACTHGNAVLSFNIGHGALARALDFHRNAGERLATVGIAHGSAEIFLLRIDRAAKNHGDQ